MPLLPVSTTTRELESPVASTHVSTRGGQRQDCPPRIAELQSVFDVLDDRPILAQLRLYRPTGRQGYPLRALWRAYVASYHLNLPHTNGLIRELQDDVHLRELCGFDPDAPLPHRRTFNRFIKRLSFHADLVDACIALVTAKLKAILPGFGKEVAIDASVIRTYSNPEKGSDPEASWGVKHSPQANNKEGIVWMYGYKLHMVVDANYGIPLAQFVTTGKRHESEELPPLIDKAKRINSWFAPKVAIADRGYDSAANHQSLWFVHRIIPVIHIRKPSNTDLYQGIYTKDGVPTCIGMVPMDYVGTNQKRHRLYRCRQEGCQLKDSPAGGIRHCDTEYVQDPMEDIRLFGIIRRKSKRWKKLYGKRWAVERVFKTLKQSRRLESHCLRGLRSINLHTLMSTLTYQANAYVHARAGDIEGLRWMVRKVA